MPDSGLRLEDHAMTYKIGSEVEPVQHSRSSWLKEVRLCFHSHFSARYLSDGETVDEELRCDNCAKGRKRLIEAQGFGADVTVSRKSFH